MADVKALFPIGKTQWIKWSNDQRTAFNEARAAGVPYMDAITSTNASKKKKKNVFDIIEDVAEIAVRVAEVAASVSPAVTMAKVMVKSATQKKAK
jgi:predicted negative regulator of RcsB-dependent stress response